MGTLTSFFLMLQEGIYSYEYKDSSQRLNETSLPDKKEFCSNLTMEDIMDGDYKHAKIAREGFTIQNLGEYHSLCVQRDALSLTDIFGNFCNKRIGIYELDPTYFLPVPGLARQACLKKR